MEPQTGSPPASPSSDDNGTSNGGGGATRSPKKSSAASLMKKLKANVDTAYAGLPEGMLEGQHLELNRWSVLIDDSTLKELGGLNRLRVRQSDEARRESVKALTRKGNTSKETDVLATMKKKVNPVDATSVPTYFDGVETLHIRGADRVSDYGLAQVGRNCPTLTSVDIGHCPTITDIGLRELAIGCSSLTRLNLARCPKVKNVGIVAIGQYCTGMTSLNISNNWKLESWLLARIAEFHELRTLNMTNCVMCDDKTLKAIGNHCHQLKKLTLTGCKLISDVGLLELTKGCGRLEELHMPRTALFFKITDVSLLTLADRTPGLTKLDLSGNELITDVGMDWLASGCHALSDLNITGLFKVTDAGLRCLAEGCVDLLSLNMSGLRYCTDVGVRHLSQGCRKIEKLNLDGMYLLSNGMGRSFGWEGLQALSQECSHLKMISLGNCFQVASRVLTALAKGCSSLEDLRFAGCTKVDSEAIISMAKKLTTTIKRISFPGCVSLDSVGIIQLAKRCPNIMSVNLSQCDHITDSAVQALAKHCKGMTSLNVSECRAISDYSLLAISEGDLIPGLSSLSLKGTEVTDTGVTWLAERCTSLMTLNLTKCGNVSYAGIKAIRESWRHVQLIKTENFFGLKPVHRGKDKRYIDEFGAVWKAATKIQSIYRSKIARRKMAVAREEHLRHYVARKLQSVWRGRKARRYVILKRMQKNREEDAAIKMQCVFRAKRARRVLAQRQLEYERRKMIWAACLVQRNYRGKLARTWFLKQKQAQQEYVQRCNEAAMMVQSCWRGRQARRAAQLKRAMNSLQERSEQQAASKLQRIYRGRMARKVLKRKKMMKMILGNKEEESALKIQTLFRKRMKWRKDNASKDYEKQRNEAAIKLQGMYRARKGRKFVNLKRAQLRANKEEKAAIILQNCWRRKKGMMVLNMLKKGKLMQAEEEDLAARKIQKVFRGHKSRKRVKLMSADRYMQQKKQENLEEWAALQVQRMFRGREGRLRFAARQVEVARRWKIMFDENQGRVFYYNMNTGEIRWRKPQELLELDARPQCDNCSVELAEVECGQCTEFFCAECWDAVHFGGKRKGHKFRCLYDYYRRRIDYGDGEFPSIWPTELEQDDLYGWHKRGEDPRAKSRGGQGGGAGGAGGPPGAPSASGHGALSLPLENIQRWAKYWDEPSGAYFYFNAETSESTYERPMSYRSEMGDDAGGGGGGGTTLALPNGGWGKFPDEENGSDFFYNEATGESTYDRPENFQTPAPSARLVAPSGTSTNGYDLTSSQVNSGWEKHWSDQWNLHYFHNLQTGVSTFDRPTEFQTPRVPEQHQSALELGQGGWAKFWDDENECEFYFHEDRGVSQFERPIVYNSPAPTPRDPSAGVVPDLQLGTSEWQKYYDDAAQAYYYYNSNSGESSYDRPAFFQTPR